MEVTGVQALGPVWFENEFTLDVSPQSSCFLDVILCCVNLFRPRFRTQEQLFIAGGGLLGHLVQEITSDGVWCAGSLQTAFDLLGELCKGNREVKACARFVRWVGDCCNMIMSFMCVAWRHA